MKSQSPSKSRPVSTVRRKKKKQAPVGGNGNLVVFTVGGEERVGYIQDGRVVSDSENFSIAEVKTVNKIILLIYTLSSIFPSIWECLT